MKRCIVLEKPVGQTPLEAITAWKAKNPAYADTPACYAGRLDPMASGKLLVLLGDECRRQKDYHGLDKEYAIEVVLDLATDTGDALGIPRAAGNDTEMDRKKLAGALKRLLGTHAVPYPAYSSKTVNGKPLFQYALEGSLNTIEIPVHDETIYAMRVSEVRTMAAPKLAERIDTLVAQAPRADEPAKALGADFRQDAIGSAWKELFASASLPDRSFTVVSLRVTCASGTYMRTLACRIAAGLGTSGFALSIHRTRIGRHLRLGPLGLWTKEYS
ncbi:MAG TPA: hypothetical protein VHO23_02960 [Candidatus Paceibacterota bacterium]|nr:hypothetical protein [Candidatus Paceibacterota bacterium]